MIVTLIRHGKTEGNLRKAYIGRTDEPLCPEGVKALKEKQLPMPSRLIVSPMLRCRQSAQILFPGKEARIVHELREIDFGRFEGKNWQELSGDPAYQAWIDSGGTMAFPDGEAMEDFKARCRAAFASELKRAMDDAVSSLTFVVHGGTVMAVMEAFGLPQKNYYDWQIPGGSALTLRLDEAAFSENRPCLILE